MPTLDNMPIKGDTIIGNDVWIGQNTTVVGNPAKRIRKRFDDELIRMMLKLKWWDLPIEEINQLIPVLSNNNLDEVKEQLRKYE